VLVCVWACVGACRLAVWQRTPAAHLALLLPERPAPVRLHAVVRSEPQALERWRGGAAWSCELEVRHLERAGRWQCQRGRLAAVIERRTSDLAYGDEILAEGMWASPLPAGNPGQFNQRAALARRGMYGQVRVRRHDSVVWLARGQGWRWMDAALQLRRRCGRMIQDALPPEGAGLLRSLLLGERVALGEQVKEAFIRSGTMHLLVVSGSNVGLVLLMVELLLRWVGVARAARLALCAAALAGYCALTGLQTPVVRATAMGWLYLGARALDRPVLWGNLLAAAALGMLWVNPVQLFDPSFQLSFGAVLSLLLFTAPCRRLLERIVAWIPPSRVRAYALLSISATVAVWVGLWPLLAWYFRLVAPISVVANLLAAPLVAAVTVLGAVGLGLGAVVPATFAWCSGPMRLLLDALLACVSWCRHVPGGHVHVGDPGWPVVAGYYGLMALSVLCRRLRRNGWN
jgi:competence protein ComEC